MKLRPCIDIHNGKVKQIVGSSLQDENDRADENFVSEYDAAYYADLYRREGLTGGHVILLNPPSSVYYEATKEQALKAIGAYPNGLQLGGGVNDGNAEYFLDAGASKVIVTSYVFRDGHICYENLRRLAGNIGKEHLVLDLSCRKKDGAYYIVTDRWQKFTQVCLNEQTLDELSGYCSEFLVHAADAEGKSGGIETEVAELLGEWGKIPVTYAGGVSSYADLDILGGTGKGRVDVTIGTALDIFGGPLAYTKVLEYCQRYAII